MNKFLKSLACCAFIFAGFCVYAQEEEAVENEVVLDSYDEYTGWKYTVDKHAVAENRDVRIRLRGDNGTFALYTINSKGKEVPLFSSYKSNSESFFVLKVGRKQYTLNSTGGVASEARKTENGVQLAYTIPGKAYCVLDFSFPKNEAVESLQNIVRVTMYTVNIGETPQTFTLKGVFDTILGEASGKHFSTAINEKLNYQKQLHSMKDDKWIRSANKNTVMQFMLDGYGISEPEEVSVTSLKLLTKYWIPEVVDSKGFSMPASYNNSGVGINWKTAYLNPNDVDVKTFYLSIAEGVAPVYAGKEPAGLDFLSALEQETVFDGLPVKEVEEDISGSEVEIKEPEEVELSPAAQAVTEEQLDPEYIQNLIDYIESIKSEEDIETEELISLNEELDAIFERLRSIEKQQ